MSKEPTAPSPPDFYRRGYHSSAVIGDYVYIDKGEVISGLPGETASSYLPNQTISIPLHHSWTNQTVSLKTFPSTPDPGLLDTTLWTDKRNGVAYRFGGQATDGTNFNENFGPYFWKFTPGKSGNGKWTSLPGPSWMRLSPHLGYSTASKSTGYYILGSIDPENFSSRPITYDFEKKQWSNMTNPFGRQVHGDEGQALYIPLKEKDGLTVMVGGSRATGVGTKSFQYEGVSMDNITIYDTASQKWLWQVAAGQTPPPRGKFCATLAQGSHGSFEIFIYGGTDTDFNTDSQSYGDIHVLSIPAFRWFKVPNDGAMAESRYSHTCELVGNRQMLVIGGLTGGDTQTRDPLAQGLGIFDLSSLQWKAQYDVNAAPYEAPYVVRKWYSKTEPNSVHWISNDVKSLFDFSNSKSNPFGQPIHSASPSNPSPSKGSKGSKGSTNDSGGNSGPLIGGIVGGVVGFLLLAGIAIFLFWRRRRRSSKPVSQPDEPGAELHGEGIRSDSKARSELAPDQRHELEPQGIPELPQAQRFEMYADETQEADGMVVYELDSDPKNLKGLKGEEVVGPPEKDA